MVSVEADEGTTSPGSAEVAEAPRAISGPTSPSGSSGPSDPTGPAGSDGVDGARPTDGTDRRGQLVLAGSVAIAVAVVGVAVLLNAAMYTGAVAADDRPREAASAAETYRQAVETDLQRLVEETGDGDGPPDEAALRRNVTTYRDRMALAAARSASASVDVRLVDASPPSYTFVFTFDTPELHYRTTVSVTRGAP